MKRISTRHISFFCGLAALCLLATPALACSCGTPATAKAGMQKSDAVFVGKVVGIRRQTFFTKAKLDLGGGKSKMITVSAVYYKLKFAVSQSWKGAPKRTTTIFAKAFGGCSRQYFKNTIYLVYANNFRDPRWKTKKGMYASYCSRTAKVNDAKKDLAELGKGKVP